MHSMDSDMKICILNAIGKQRPKYSRTMKMNRERERESVYLELLLYGYKFYKFPDGCRSLQLMIAIQIYVIF